MKIGVILLAAGSSSRLGFPKQLVKFKGKSLLQHSIDVAQSVNFDVKILVLGSKADEIKKEIDPGKFEVVINDHWKKGIGTSISFGISEILSKEKDLDHILIMLCDQPFITRDKVEDLIKVQLDSKNMATFSKYAGNVGVPTIFSRGIFSELKNLKGDQGAKILLSNKDIKFETISFENGNFDVDTPTDVVNLKPMEESKK